jgi:hypothetical protein
MARDCDFTLYTKHSLQGVHEHSAVRAVAESSGNFQTSFFCQLTEKQPQYLHNISLRVIWFCIILLTLGVHQIPTPRNKISCIQHGLPALQCLLLVHLHVHSNKTSSLKSNVTLSSSQPSWTADTSYRNKMWLLNHVVAEVWP